MNPIREKRWAVWAVLLLLPLNLFGYTLDWDSVNWTTTWGTNGTISQTFNNVNGSGINVTIQMAEGGGAVATNTGSTPDDVNTPITNGGANEQALMVDVDFSNNERTTTYAWNGSGASYIEYTITFSSAVSGVEFDLWDIDLGFDSGSEYQDVIVFNPSESDANLTLVGSNTDSQIYTDADGNEAVRGIRAANSSSNLGNENDTAQSANVNVDYGTASLTTITFRYYSGDGERGSVGDIGFSDDNPTLQRISLHDINFIPEPSTWISGGLLVLFLAGHAFRQRRLRLA